MLLTASVHLHFTSRFPSAVEGNIPYFFARIPACR